MQSSSALFSRQPQTKSSVSDHSSISWGTAGFLLGQPAPPQPRKRECLNASFVQISLSTVIERFPHRQDGAWRDVCPKRVGLATESVSIRASMVTAGEVPSPSIQKRDIFLINLSQADGVNPTLFDPSNVWPAQPYLLSSRRLLLFSGDSYAL